MSSVKGFARVGFKIRANPSNKHSISNAVVLLAVPPDVDGENCKMSRKGGSWDELKRAMSWYVDFLHPGEAIEIQAQFPVINANESEKGRQFPLLVRCDFPTLFSNLTLTVNDQSSFRINMNSVERILHRKV